MLAVCAGMCVCCGRAVGMCAVAVCVCAVIGMEWLCGWAVSHCLHCTFPCSIGVRTPTHACPPRACAYPLHACTLRPTPQPP